MPDKNLTDNEIVKALEVCCTERICRECVYFGEKEFCIATNTPAVLDLINRQKAEIERLLQKTQRPQDADPMDFCGVLCDYAEGLIKKAKSEARKEFAERLLSCYEGFDEKMRLFCLKI